MSQELRSEDGDVDANATRRLTTVIVADICGYSRLAEVDEAAAIRSVNIIYSLFERAVLAHRGRVFNKAGDGFFAEFPSVTEGVLGAMEFVEAVYGRDTLSPHNPGVKVRTGVHVGDVVEQSSGDLLGHGVNVAARLQGEAQENGVLVSAQVVNLVDGKLDVRFVRRGSLSLKNIEQPITTFDALMGASRPFLGIRFMRGVRALGPRTLLIALAASVVAAVNFLVLNSVLETRDYRAAKADEVAARAAAEQEIDQLAGVVTRASNQTSGMQIVAIKRAIDNLLASDDPDKAIVISLIRTDRVPDAIAALDELLSVRRAENAPTPTVLQILHEIGALALYEAPERSIEAYREIDEITGGEDATAILRLAESTMLATDADQAAVLYGRLAKAALKTGDTQLEVMALIGEGRANNVLRNYAIARLKLFEALAKSEANGFLKEKSLALTYLGSSYFLSGDYEKAVDYGTQASEIEQSFTGADREIERIARTHQNIASAYIELARFDEASLQLQTAIDYYENFPEKLYLARALYNLGALQTRTDNLTAAMKTYVRALKIVEGKPGQDNLTGLLMREIAKNAHARGDIVAACGYYRRAMASYANATHKWSIEDSPGLRERCAQ